MLPPATLRRQARRPRRDLPASPWAPRPSVPRSKKKEERGERKGDREVASPPLRLPSLSLSLSSVVSTSREEKQRRFASLLLLRERAQESFFAVPVGRSFVCSSCPVLISKWIRPSVACAWIYWYPLSSFYGRFFPPAR